MAAPKAQHERVRQIDLKRLTTLGVGGTAEVWEVENDADLRAATAEPYRVIGAGSNLLVADRGVDDRVVKLGRPYNTISDFQGQRELWLGAATPVPGLVRRSADAGLSGLEGLLGVPAVLGGAVAMNAGTRFGSMADSLVAVEVFVDGQRDTLLASDLDFRYRSSTLPEGAIVTRVKLRLAHSTPDRVQATLAKVDAARRGQPKVKSAGCAFKNPVGDSAGRLIDRHGLKGLRVGQAMVSEEHGNFIVNLGGATARDVCALLGQIQNKVTTSLDVEWRLWGFREEVGACFESS